MSYTYRDIRHILLDVKVPPFYIKTSCKQCIANGEKEGWIYEPPGLHGLYNCVDVTHTWVLQAALWRQDTYSGEMGWGYGSEYIIHGEMHLGEIVKKAYVAAAAFAEHEVREAFTYKGRRILSPHIDILKLAEVAENIE